MDARSFDDAKSRRTGIMKTLRRPAPARLVALVALLTVLVSVPAAQAQSTGYKQVSAGGYHT